MDNILVDPQWKKEKIAPTQSSRISTYFKRAGIGALLGVLSVGLAACGGDVASSTSTATPQAAVGQATTPSATTAIDTGSTAVAAPTAVPERTVGGSVASTPAVDGAATASPGGTAQASGSTKLNLNELTEAQVMAAIPNFPARMVREFFEYRPWTSVLQFRKEIGKYVDQTQVTEWEKYVYVPVDPNQSDVETLKQLPGVDDATATSLLNARPYASNDAFLQALGKYANAQQVTEARAYLVAK